MQSKLLVPITLGISLVAVSAFVVYYIFKKDEEEEEYKNVKSSRVNVIEVSVPKSIVPALIGRGGSNIKEIERTTGAKVNVKEFSDKDHDVCVIRGRSDATQIAETLVHDFINQQPVNIEDSMNVPPWACGRIIGSQGENISSISHRSGARIKISSSSDKATERKVMLLGTKEQIKVAKDLIENCVAQEKCRREIEQSKRSPRHVQSSSKSPSPTPSVNTSDNAEDASGDSQVQRHVKYKRPVPENDAANGASYTTAQRERSLLRNTQSASGREQQRTAPGRTMTQQHNFTLIIFIWTKNVFVYCYYKYIVRILWRESATQEAAVQPVEKSTKKTSKVRDWPTPRQPLATVTRWRSDSRWGGIIAPNLRVPSCVYDHIDNALVEYLAIEAATKQVHLVKCNDILRAYLWNNEKQLRELLDEAEGAVYNNATQQVLRGEMTGTYMTAYCGTGAFVPRDEYKSQSSGKITFAAPEDDPVVVTAKCTKIMLHDKILNMAQTIWDSRETYGARVWPVPKIEWVNGVPGCGKTTWVVNHFDEKKDVVVTTTIEAAKDLKKRLALRLGDQVNHRVRTLASILANGFKETYYRLTVDEALMNHFGSIIMAARLAGAREIVLIGDVNQLPFLDREKLFQLWYTGPNLVTKITQELLCTHRNPMDVAYALSDIYSGIYSSKQQVHSLKVKRYTGARIPNMSAKTLFLVHTQKEKSLLASQGYGSGDGSRILTIHEAQGLTYESVVIINTKRRSLQLHDSVPHAIVAVSRHTSSCVYYTDHFDDAIACYIRRVMDAPTMTVVKYNLKMALRHRDTAVVKNMMSRSVANNQKSRLRSYIVYFFSRVNRISLYLFSFFELEE